MESTFASFPLMAEYRTVPILPAHRGNLTIPNTPYNPRERPFLIQQPSPKHVLPPIGRHPLSLISSSLDYATSVSVWMSTPQRPWLIGMSRCLYSPQSRGAAKARRIVRIRAHRLSRRTRYRTDFLQSMGIPSCWNNSGLAH